MSPWLGGGKMIRDVSFEGFTTQSAPWKLEAGTPNVAGVIGLSAALEWLSDIDIEQAENWSRGLATLAEDALAKRPGFRSFRCQDSSLLAFDFVGVHHGDMVTLLAEYGIALRAGQHCAQPLLAELGVTGTLRASLRRIIPNMMWMRWLTPLTARWNCWWINDKPSLYRTPVRHNGNGRDVTRYLSPADPVGG